jgi:hypothetical protein
MKISFCRHEEPGKIESGPEKGMSADFLTEQGIQKAVERGKYIPHEYIIDLLQNNLISS